VNLLTENRVKELINEFAERILAPQEKGTVHWLTEKIYRAKFHLPETTEPENQCHHWSKPENQKSCRICNPPEPEENPGEDSIYNLILRVSNILYEIGTQPIPDVITLEKALKPLTDRIEALEEQDRENALKFRDLFKEKKTLEAKLKNRIKDNK